jgi:hypothetical protein
MEPACQALFLGGYMQISQDKRDVLVRDISHTINKLSLENSLNMPDYVIAEMMVNMLESVIAARDTNRSRRMSSRFDALMNPVEEFESGEYAPRLTVGEDYED